MDISYEQPARPSPESVPLHRSRISRTTMGLEDRLRGAGIKRGTRDDFPLVWEFPSVPVLLSVKNQRSR